MKGKKCNGYYELCQFKGIPIGYGEIVWDDDKKAELRLCKVCLKRYLKLHPDVEINFGCEK